MNWNYQQQRKIIMSKGICGAHIGNMKCMVSDWIILKKGYAFIIYIVH